MKNSRYSFLILALFLGLTSLRVSAQDCSGPRYRDLIFDEFQVDSNVVYGANKDMDSVQISLKMDVYRPKNDTETKRPLLILMHGGGFFMNDKSSNEVTPLCRNFARMGFVTASINYRMVPLSQLIKGDTALIKAGLMAMQDAKAVVRFFRKNYESYGVDTNMIFFGGSSAGGFTALHLAYLHTNAEGLMITTQQVLNEVGGMEGVSGNAGYSSKIHGAINLVGGLPTTKWINAGEPPVICMHSINDPVSPYRRGLAQSFAQMYSEGSFVVDSMARAQGIESAFFTYHSNQHTPYVASATDPNGAVIPEYADTTFRFLRDNVYYWVCNIRINTLTANEDRAETAALSVFPNPAQDRLNVCLPQTPAMGTRLQLFDPTGRIVLENAPNAAQTTLLLPNLPAGLYRLRVAQPNLPTYAAPVVIR